MSCVFLGSRSSPGNALFLEGKESSECCDDPKCSVQKKGAKAGGSIGRKKPLGDWEKRGRHEYTLAGLFPTQYRIRP